jgi:hypothetical protein
VKSRMQSAVVQRVGPKECWLDIGPANPDSKRLQQIELEWVIPRLMREFLAIKLGERSPDSSSEPSED